MKKKHPLRRMLMATVSTVSGVILLLALKPTSAPASAAAGMPAPAATSAAAKGAASPPATSSTAAGSKQTTAAAAAQTRTITGTTVQTQYGPVQVQITVTGKRLTGTTLVQYPN